MTVCSNSLETSAETGGFVCRSLHRVTHADDDVLNELYFESKQNYWGDDYCTGIFDNDYVEHGACPGIYFVSQWGEDVFWYGRSKHNRILRWAGQSQQYANVGFGKVCGSQIQVDWADIPLGGDRFAGVLVLESNIYEQELRKVSDTSRVFGGYRWKKRLLPDDKFACPGVQTSIGPQFSSCVDAKSFSVIKDYGLQKVFEEEQTRRSRAKALVNLYTLDTPFYRHLNRALRRDSKQLAAWGGYITDLQSALLTLDPFHGVVFRGVQGASADDYPVGSEFFWPGFTSTSERRSTASNFGDLYFQILIVAPVHCPRIAECSAFGTEAEVLMPPYTRLRVTANDGAKIELITVCASAEVGCS